MIGEGLKLSIDPTAVGKSPAYQSFYFPAGVWCDLFSHEGVNNTCFWSNVGTFKILRVKAYDFYLHIREGYIVPM